MFIQRPYNRFEIEIEDAPPFANTKSLDFDGVDDYVSAPQSFLNSASTFSMSLWAKKPTAADTSEIGDRIAVYQGMWINWYSDSNVYFQVRGGANESIIFSLPFDTDWHHFLCTFNNGLANVYVDGILKATQTFTAVVTPPTTGDNFRIGSLDASNFGKSTIDEVALWDSVIPIGDVWDGSGAATDLSLLATPPLSWYRMGDNGAYKSPQWLIPSDENKDKVSNYSYEFQGINSRQITVGTVNVGTTNTTSMWLKRNVLSTQQTLLGGSSATSPNYYMLLFTSNEFYVRYSPTVYLGWTQSNVTTIFNNTTDWINIVVVRSGNTVNLHLNGGAAIAPDISVGGAIGALDTQFTDIGADTGGINPTNGIINNIATWNVDTVLPSDIYNGGTPPDLTTLSTAPVNWWKMGEDATLVYAVNPNGAWTIPDNVGANDGTTLQTSTIFQRVGTAPNSENNAVSINMDLIDRVPDTPLTP